jgi:ubiquinone/menaquinone biosynthesis C-methylase UbiE
MYREFARFYEKGFWPDYSLRMARLFPAVLKRLGLHPERVLDVACGEGTFAVALAREGVKVTGIDLSPDMLALAKEKAARENLAIDFINQDMRLFDFNAEFDLATCWYDSLNYILKPEELVKTFGNVLRALKPGGYFVFDMNTIQGLAVDWQRYPHVIELNTAEMFQVISPSYDFEQNIVKLAITGFLKEGELWRRIDEEHTERGYTIAEIRRTLKKAGFTETHCVSDLGDMTPPNQWSDRVWFIVQKLVVESKRKGQGRG